MQTIFIATSMPGRARPDYFMALAESFAKDGFKVIMIFDGKPKNLPYREKIVCFSWPHKRPTGLADFLFLIKLIRKYRPNILISSFGSVTVMNICGLFAGIKNRINYVLSVSDIFNNSVTGISFYKNKFFKYRKASIYKLATLLVANSKGVAEDLTSYYGLKNSNITLLPNLIDAATLPYNDEEERKRQLLIVGNLIKLKGHSILLEQFKETLNVFPDLKLVIIGTGPEKEPLMSKTENLGLRENVEFLGSVPYQNIRIYFSKSLIHVSASINEAFGFVNIEAMREGTPIIVTKSAGGRDLIKNDVNGCFFNLDNKNSLTEAISEILMNWKRYSLGAQKTFMENYELDSQIENHKKLLISKFI